MSDSVCIWVGSFPSRRQYVSYFCPPDDDPHGPSPFGVDQGEPLFNDLWTWSDYRDAGPTENLRQLLEGCDDGECFCDQACEAYARSEIGPVNTVFLAYRNVIPAPKPVHAHRHQLHVLGRFDYEAAFEDDEESEDDRAEPAPAEIDDAAARAVAGNGPMDEERFWGTIERAWQAVPHGHALRKKFLKRCGPDLAVELQFGYCSSVIAVLEAAVSQLNKRDLVKFDRLLERRLYQLDRREIHNRTGGSGDGFLYCRGFIVALGRDYYDMVEKNPGKALSDVEFEPICMCAVREYVERYDEPFPPSRISRESFSNKQGWK